MKAPFSPYLDRIVPGLKQLLILLSREYPYVSVLSTDSAGFAVRISQRSKSVSEKTMTTERGSVVRVWNVGPFDPDRPEETAQALLSSLRAQRDMLCAVSCPVYTTPPIPDEACQVRFEADTELLPENTDMEKLIGSLTEISDSGMKKGSHMIDLSVSAQSTHISKLFLTANRDMRQSYVYSEGSVSAICSNASMCACRL